MPSFSPLYKTAKSIVGTFEYQNCLIVKHEFGYQHIRSFLNGCFQIQYSQSAHADWFSYALEDPLISKLKYIHGSGEINIQSEIELKIETKSGLVSWSQNGILLGGLEHDLGFGFLGERAIACLKLHNEEQFFGLGEKTGNLNRRGSAFTNWNTDAFGYGVNQDPIYASIPFYMSIQNGICYGVFLDCTNKSRFNFGASNRRMVQISVENGPINLVLIPGPSPQDVLKRYSEITGRTPQPPRWALGLHQSRYSYRTQNEVEMIASQFRFRDIPLDCIHLDIHYMDAFKVFSVNKGAFPNLKKLANSLKRKGIRLVAIQDPGIKSEPGYGPFDSGMEQNLFVMYPDGNPWEASVWPGICRFPDFTKPETRSWWAKLTHGWVLESGISGLWNDMNEPATWGQDVPDLVEFNLEGRKGSHLEAHNIYGQLMARSTREGLIRALPDEKTFVLTRAGFAGIQRYAAVWTGDNVASAEHLFLGIRLVLSLGMSGVPFSGVDVGGFVGDSNSKLFVRWISIAAFFPFFRIHSMIDSKSSEPWTYGELAEAIARNYIRLRYKILPMLESAFHNHSVSGSPILIPFFWKSNHYEFKIEFQHQFFLGDQFLIIPGDPERDAVWAEIPNGNWYHLLSGEKIIGGKTQWMTSPVDQLPILVPESSIIVTKSPGKSAEDPEAEEYQLHIFWGEKPGRFTLYRTEIFGSNSEKESYLKVDISVKPIENDFELVLDGLNRSGQDWKFHSLFLWHFPEQRDKKWFAHYDTYKMEFEKSTFSWIDPLPDFDPFESKSNHYHSQCLGVHIPFKKEIETIHLKLN